MSVSKDSERGTFYVQCRYRDWMGEPKKKTKRGFKTEKEVRNWEFEFLKRMEGAPTHAVLRVLRSLCRGH